MLCVVLAVAVLCLFSLLATALFFTTESAFGQFLERPQSLNQPQGNALPIVEKLTGGGSRPFH
nr:MAG TPA: rich Proline-rich [Caudoviricetes sp.]